MRSLRLTCALALSLCAPVMFGGSYERFPLPRTVAVDVADVAAADTYVWVAQSLRLKVSRVALDGTVLDTFGLPFTSFLSARQMALDPDDGGVWCTDGAALVHVAPTGEVLKFELPEPIQTNAVQDILVAADDHIYVARRTDVVRVSREGETTQFPLFDDHQFDPVALAAGPDGNVWLAAHIFNKVGRLTPAGDFTAFANLDADSPNGIAAGSDGNLWFTSDNGKLRKISVSGSVTNVVPGVPATGTIVSGSDGRLWFGSGTTAVQRYDISTNTIVDTYAVSEATGSVWPMSANDTSGVWWASSTSTLHRISYDGVAHDTVFKPDGVEPGRMASSAQYVWFVAPEANQIGRTNPEDHTTVMFDLPHAASFPQDIVAGPGGMWFTERAGNRIGRIDANGAITEYDVLTPSGNPARITLGPDGNLWFTLPEADKIGRITPAGVVTEFPLPGLFRYPWSITAGADQNLWITLRQSNQIARMTMAGEVTEFDAGGTTPEEILPVTGGDLWYKTTDKLHRMNVLGEIPTTVPYPSVSQMILADDNTLRSVSPDSPLISRATLDGVVAHLPLPQLLGQGITTGPDGMLWFDDRLTQALYRIHPDVPLTGIYQPLCHEQGSPYSGVVAQFVDFDTNGTVADYSAQVDWGDHSFGPPSPFIEQTSPGHFSVHAQAPNGDTPTVVKIAIVARPRSGLIGQTLMMASNVSEIVGWVDKTSFYSDGGTGTVTMNTPAPCGWTIGHSADWITFVDADTGTGGKEVKFTVAPNNTGADRSTTLNLAGTTATITQLATATPGNSLYIITPCRLVDTRIQYGPIGQYQTWKIDAANRCGIPATAKAVAVNVTAIAPSDAGWFAVFPDGQTWTGASTLNYRHGRTRANNAIVPLQNGAFDILNGGLIYIHFAIDVTAYFQ